MKTTHKTVGDVIQQFKTLALDKHIYKTCSVLTCATMWINVENTVLNKRSQIQKSLCLYEIAKICKYTEADNILVVAKGLEVGEIGSDC